MLGQRGDTIVEVVIAIAVASAALVGAYASTNKNSLSVQTAQERTQAVKLVETQIEYLRSAGQIAPGSCFVVDTGSGTPGQPILATGSQGANACIVTSNASKANANDQPAYTLSVAASAPGTYKVSAVWAAIGGTGTNNVEMYYRPVVTP